MKSVILLLFLLVTGSQVAFSQQSGEQRYFVQAMVSSQVENVDGLVSELRANPNVFVVRYDQLTQGLMFVTHPMNFELNTELVESWLGAWFPQLYCLRIGLQNVDKHLPFPLTNCGE
jgi:hypothetical protein